MRPVLITFRSKGHRAHLVRTREVKMPDLIERLLTLRAEVLARLAAAEQIDPGFLTLLAGIQAALAAAEAERRSAPTSEK